MNKKAKIALAVTKKGYDKFPKCKNLLAKHRSKNAARETLLLRRYILALIINVNFFCVMLLCLSMVCYEITKKV